MAEKCRRCGQQHGFRIGKRYAECNECNMRNLCGKCYVKKVGVCVGCFINASEEVMPVSQQEYPPRSHSFPKDGGRNEGN